MSHTYLVPVHYDVRLKCNLEREGMRELLTLNLSLQFGGGAMAVLSGAVNTGQPDLPKDLLPA